MNDGQLRALCHRFFDALEQRDVRTVAELYADDLRFWFNATDHTSGRDENLEALTSGYAVHRRRQYNDRIINTFHGGFVMQYTLNLVYHDGSKAALYPCVVALCRDGQIVRMDEYIDSGRFRARMTDSREAAPVEVAS